MEGAADALDVVAGAHAVEKVADRVPIEPAFDPAAATARGHRRPYTKRASLIHELDHTGQNRLALAALEVPLAHASAKRLTVLRRGE